MAKVNRGWKGKSGTAVRKGGRGNLRGRGNHVSLVTYCLRCKVTTTVKVIRGKRCERGIRVVKEERGKRGDQGIRAKGAKVYING